MIKAFSFHHFILIIAVCMTTTASGEPSTYRLAQKEDISFVEAATGRRIVRWEYRVHVPNNVSESSLMTIASNIVDNAKQSGPLNAVGIFFYLPDSDPKGLYTAGKAVYAPNGKWEDASKALAGSYYAHRLALSVGNAIGITTPKTTPRLSDSQKKKLFYDLVSLQDKGVSPKDSYSRIAAQYGLSEKEVTDIQLEGTTRGWPMP
jgi:hypothetical protein